MGIKNMKKMFNLVPPMTGHELVEKEYLEMRSHLLEVAAAFDRIDRAGGSDDPRLKRLREIAVIAVGEEDDRARRFLGELSV
jgi:predicted RecB family endonuclease